MERLFRKRAVSSAEQPPQPHTTLRKPPSSHDLKGKGKRKEQESVEQRDRRDTSKTSLDAPPRLDVDIRNSLILPVLSRRFSVLIPTLSAFPEASIRSLLASQRTREGPSITQEEEDLLLAELRQERVGPSPGLLTTSTSSPSILSQAESPYSAPVASTSAWTTPSPPPTSVSFSSFRTFGVGVNGDDVGIKIKSYGFSAGSAFRDDEYIRRIKRSASNRNLSSSTFSESSLSDDSRILAANPALAPTPGESVNRPGPADPTITDSTPTPSNPVALTKPHSDLSGRKRQSLFASLAPAQVKRISMALEEIGGELRGRRPSVSEIEEIDEATEERATLPESHTEVPLPILTPSRTMPLRHTPTPSLSTVSSPYVPGQPRPVGSMHRSEGSTSSPSITPSQSLASSSPLPTHTRTRAGSTPSPIIIAPTINERTSSLARSRSVNHAENSTGTPSRQYSTPLGPPSAERIEETDEDFPDDDTATFPAIPAGPRSSISPPNDDVFSSADQLPSPHTLRRRSSPDSCDSQYMGDFDYPIQTPILTTPNEDPTHVLQNLGGVSKQDLAAMQEKLVAKARVEREAIRSASAESPMLSSSPQVLQGPFQLFPQSAASRSTSSVPGHPPAVRRATEERPSSPFPTSETAATGSAAVFSPTAPRHNLEDTPPTSRRPPEEDPEVRRDFEARIAAATAALNRTPSRAGSRLERKPTKRGGAMTISSPKLVSSSAKLPASPVTPSSEPVSKALEKASGSASKMSLRWKKLAFRRRPSTSAEPSPPTASTAQSDSPLSLPKASPQQNLHSFRFPQAPTGDQDRADRQPLHSPAAIYSSSSSSNSAVTKFIQAGHAVGLNQEELEIMLEEKAMLKRSGTTASTTSHQSTAPTTASLADPSPKSPDIAQMPATDRPGGLFRKFSRGRQTTARPADLKGLDTRHSVVRRTLIVPTHEAPVLPPGPSSSEIHSGQRKLSVKRKPINLTDEDRQLVTPSIRAESSTDDSQHQSEGKAFLRPPSLLGPPIATISRPSFDGPDSSLRQSSGGGSIYDLYNDDAPQELLSDSPPDAQGVEITEYADGRVAWSIIDALRDPESPTLTVDPRHSVDSYSRRASSHSSRKDSSEMEPRWPLMGQTPALNLRHRDRDNVEPRPPTNVFYTHSSDVADLIDHLSRDLETSRGRIDIHPSSPEGPELQDSVRQSEPRTLAINKPNATMPAGGFSPKRQLFIRQGFAAHRHGVGVNNPAGSPSAASFASSTSGQPGRSVEERLQALLDRLQHPQSN